MVFAALLVLVSFRGRRSLVVLGAIFGLGLSLLAIAVVISPEPLLRIQWSYSGQPTRISTSALSDLIGNQEVADRVEADLAPGEMMASEVGASGASGRSTLANAGVVDTGTKR